MLICWTSKGEEVKPSRDFRKITFEDLSLVKNPAPISSYSFYELPNNWNVINTYFMDKMNLKLNECQARKEIVEVVKDRIIEKPMPISWFQEPTILAWGIPLTFTGGVILGVILSK